MTYNQSQGPQHASDHAWPSLQEYEIIQNFMGNSIVIQIVVEYNAKM
jgi:hypothetical protein